MSQDDYTPPDQTHPGFDSAEQATFSKKALGNLLENITPWLFEVGSWIFGGLIAFNLVLISALLTVGPVDRATLISITAFACALPLNVAGIFLLRLIKDLKEIGIEDVAMQAFQDAGFPDVEAYFPRSEEKQGFANRRSNIALSYSVGVGGLSAALTWIGMVAALWHMAWWIGVILSIVVLLSAVLVIAVIGHSHSWESEVEKQLKQRYLEQRTQERKKSSL